MCVRKSEVNSPELVLSFFHIGLVDRNEIITLVTSPVTPESSHPPKLVLFEGSVEREFLGSLF